MDLGRTATELFSAKLPRAHWIGPEWARGGEGASAELPRATWSRPNSGRIIFFIFSRLAATANRLKPLLRTEVRVVASRDCG